MARSAVFINGITDIIAKARHLYRLMAGIFSSEAMADDQQCRIKLHDAIRGFRSRSSDPRRRSCKAREESSTKRACSHPMFSSVCKLPSLTCKKDRSETRLISTRPWSRTQDELRKYKEALE
ncbi:hypothetical protein GCK32_003996 [Trichostrongylus colubriformis]|uniref:Uncharacterized protein n=1 Tax=Trichostrongylus colubriformis TaxID=6319 RepID=A0AAN8FC85_TRICO